MGGMMGEDGVGFGLGLGNGLGDGGLVLEGEW